MEVKKVSTKIPWFTLLGAIGIFILGILFIMMDEILVEAVLILGAVGLLLVYGIVRMVQCFKIKKHLEGIISLVICWGVAAALYLLDFSNNFVALVPSVIVGIVSLILGIARLLICINCIANKYRGAFRNGLSSAMCLFFGIALVVRPIDNFSFLSMVTGIYMVVYSFTMFGDVFATLFHLDMSENRLRRRTHRALPNIINAVKPSSMITDINNQIKAGKVTSGVLIEEKKNTKLTTPNMEVLIHLTTQGANKFGHVDIAIGDTVYTYGTYDSSTVKMGGFIAQGCFVIVPKIPYLKYCLNYQKKYVIGFGVELSPKQLSAVKDKIDEMMAWCKPFVSNYERANLERRDGSVYDDPASNIVRDLGGKVYVVKRGPFRHYFGINTNCVHVADWLLSDSGIDAISFSSLRTPGAYYTMMNNMFMRKNNRVIRKTTYILADDITAESAGLLPAKSAESGEDNSGKE